MPRDIEARRIIDWLAEATKTALVPVPSRGLVPPQFPCRASLQHGAFANHAQQVHNHTVAHAGRAAGITHQDHGVVAAEIDGAAKQALSY